MAGWIDKPPKGTRCQKKDWVHWKNGSFIAGTVKNWGDEEIYLMRVNKGGRSLLMGMTMDEAAAICSVLSTTIMTAIWDQRGQEYETEDASWKPGGG